MAPIKNHQHVTGTLRAKLGCWTMASLAPKKATRTVTLLLFLGKRKNRLPVWLARTLAPVFGGAFF